MGVAENVRVALADRYELGRAAAWGAISSATPTCTSTAASAQSVLPYGWAHDPK